MLLGPGGSAIAIAGCGAIHSRDLQEGRPWISWISCRDDQSIHVYRRDHTRRRIVQIAIASSLFVSGNQGGSAYTSGFHTPPGPGIISIYSYEKRSFSFISQFYILLNPISNIEKIYKIAFGFSPFDKILSPRRDFSFVNPRMTFSAYESRNFNGFILNMMFDEIFQFKPLLTAGALKFSRSSRKFQLIVCIYHSHPSQRIPVCLK